MFDGKLREIEGSTLAFNFWLAFRLLACLQSWRLASQVSARDRKLALDFLEKRLKKSTKSEGSTLAFNLFGQAPAFGHRGTSWERLARVLRASWGVLGASCRRLGGVLGRLGRVLGRLGGVMGHLVGVLRPSWKHLGLSWCG